MAGAADLGGEWEEKWSEMSWDNHTESCSQQEFSILL